MECPECGAPDTYVSRTYGVRRVRRCPVCGHEFDTVETTAAEARHLAFRAAMFETMKGNGDREKISENP